MSGNYVGRGPDVLAAILGQPNGAALLDGAGKVVKTQFPLLRAVTFNRDMTVASGNQAVVGVGFKPRAVILFATAAPGGATGQASVGMANDGAPITQASASASQALAPGTWNIGSGFCVNIIEAVGISYGGALASFDPDGFTIAWTRTGAKANVVTVQAFCLP